MLKNIMICSFRDGLKRPILAPRLSSSPRLVAKISPLSTNILTPQITFITNDKRSRSEIRDLAAYSSEGRPLSIILSWLMAKPSAVLKYAQFYLDQGFDVLKIQISPLQLLLPTTVEPVVHNDILPILRSSDHQHKLIHGFSVGLYLFTRMMRHMADEPSGKYQELRRSVKGQIWDSPTDVNGVSIGVSNSIFHNSPIMRQGLKRYVDFHLKAFHNISTKYYLIAHDMYYNDPLKVPALWFYSEIDQISTLDRNEAVQREWVKRGIQCTKKTWKDTQHVGHMRAHPDEYQATLKTFLRTIGIVNKKETVDNGYRLATFMNNKKD